MQISTAYYVHTHEDGFRSGKPAEIVGVVMAPAPDGKTMRPCFRIRWLDGVEEYPPVMNADCVRAGGLGEFYEIITAEQVAQGYRPAITLRSSL